METAAPAAPAAPAAAPAEGAAPTEGGAAPVVDANGAPVVETKPEVKVETPVIEQRETALRAQLHKREQELNARESKAKLSDEERTELVALRSLKGRAKEDAIGVLQELGLDAETVFRALQSGKGPMDPVARKALEKAEALEKQLEAQKSESQKQAELRDVAQVRDGLSILVKREADRYEMIMDEGQDGIEAWREAVNEFGATRKRAPTLEEVQKLGDLVETAYRSNWDRKASTKYAKSKLTPTKVEAKPDDAKPEPTRSLNNGLDGRPASKTEAPTRRLSHAEELELNMREAGLSFKAPA